MNVENNFRVGDVIGFPALVKAIEGNTLIVTVFDHGGGEVSRLRIDKDYRPEIHTYYHDEQMARLMESKRVRHSLSEP